MRKELIEAFKERSIPFPNSRKAVPYPVRPWIPIPIFLSANHSCGRPTNENPGACPISRMPPRLPWEERPLWCSAREHRPSPLHRRMGGNGPSRPGLLDRIEVSQILALSGKEKIISLFARPRDPNPHSACRFRRFGRRPSWKLPRSQARERKQEGNQWRNSSGLSFSCEQDSAIIGRLEFLSCKGFFRLPIDLRSYRLVR